MIPRTRLIITAVLLCHAFVLPTVVTSQLRPAQPQQNQAPATPAVSVQSDSGKEDTATEHLVQKIVQESDEQDLGPQRPATNVPLGRNEVLIRADQQEKNQDIYNVKGHVTIRFGGNVLHADEARYDSTTGILKANGHVVFDSTVHNAHLVGTSATYDVSRDTGQFYDVTGSTGMRVKNKTMFLTSSTPFFFTGKQVDKLGPDEYRVHHGYVTSCQLPRPKWKLQSETANVEVGDEATLHHATLRMGGIPVFYFPFLEHPVDNLGRKSGFLIPTIGQSNTRGTIFGEGFYWAISRNSDATLGAALYSKRGWAQFGEFRAIGYTYGVQASYYGVVDNQGSRQPYNHGQNQGGEDVRVNAFKNFDNGFSGVLSADYLSSFIFRQAFALGLSEAIQSEVISTGFVYKNWNGYAFGVMADSYQDYQSNAPGDYIQIVHSPTAEFSTAERQFSRVNAVYSYDFAAAGVSRNEIGFETSPLVGRIDAAPYLAWPKLFHGWTFRPQIGGRETFYTERVVPGSSATVIGIPVQDPMNRTVGNASFELRPPTLSRLFDRKPFGYAIKHTVEPYAVYRYQGGIGDFSQIIRFDYRDILADTNEVEYGVVNRIFSKRTKLSPRCFQHPEYADLSENLITEQSERSEGGGVGICKDKAAPARELFSWAIAQKYFGNPDFGGALVPGKRNVFDTTVDFTGIAFLTEPRVLSPVISRLRASAGLTDFQWDLDYDPVLHQVNASTVFAGYRLGNVYLNGGQTYVNLPGLAVVNNNGQIIPSIYNQWRLGAIYGGMNRRGLSGAFSVGIDSRSDLLQSATIQTNYNWDCCGVAFQYTRWAFSALSQENAFRFSFSLTNFGTFGSIKRIDRLY
jgi:LPS-assembly protein